MWVWLCQVSGSTIAHSHLKQTTFLLIAIICTLQTHLKCSHIFVPLSSILLGSTRWIVLSYVLRTYKQIHFVVLFFGTSEGDFLIHIILFFVLWNTKHSPQKPQISHTKHNHEMFQKSFTFLHSLFFTTILCKCYGRLFFKLYLLHFKRNKSYDVWNEKFRQHKKWNSRN